MMDLAALLAEKGIRRAVVFDDAFDIAPRPDDLSAVDWTVFFDDLTDDDSRKLSELYPDYDETPREELQISEHFVTHLWDHRGELSAAAQDRLFHEYEQTSANDRATLEALVTALKDLNLACETMGRDFSDDALGADLFLVDLFLGFTQSERDMSRAIKRVRALVGDRVERPPLIILMSRSPHLREKRDEFRDGAGLLGSTFRVVSKADLKKEGNLERLLIRLVDNYDDARRVAKFVHAWDGGLDNARERFIQTLRRLDLPDLAQVQALLLEFEGQGLGEYLLDVCDRVFQHEIEASPGTIAAAQALNAIDLARYPAPHLSGTHDLQVLVHKMMFQHTERLKLSETDNGVQLQFGDLLRWKKDGTDEYGKDVSLVMTPACDLMRDEAKRVLLLSGTLMALKPKKWSYKVDPVRTAIAILPDESRYWIKWNLRDFKALSWDELNKLFGDGECLKRIGRLREGYAIEIQQRFLAMFGRIGQPALMPAPFPIDVSIFYVGLDAKAKPLEIDEIDLAACYVGRAAEVNPIHRLVISERACQMLEEAVADLDAVSVHASARPSLEALKADQAFFTRFERGEIEIPETEGAAKSTKSDENKVYVVVVRGGNLSEGDNLSGDQKKTAMLIKVTDIGGVEVIEAA